MRMFLYFLVFLIWLAHHCFFLYMTRGDVKRWFWGQRPMDHGICAAGATIALVIELLALAQPMAFLKYLFS